jgi:hypothetical protein
LHKTYIIGNAYSILGELQMSRVGMYTYPLFRLNALLGTTKTLHEKFGNKDFTREHVAQVLNQKPTSGGLSQKLADLKSYGLISDSQSRYTVTDLGIKATFGRDAERTAALDKAVRNIPLWKVIYEKCGKDPLADTFDLDLAEITGITAPESKNVANSVRKSYIEDIKYLLTVKTPAKEAEPEKSNTGDDPEPARGRNIGMEVTQASNQNYGGTQFAKFEFGKSSVVIADRESLDVISGFLSNLKGVLDKQSAQPPVTTEVKQPVKPEDQS